MKKSKILCYALAGLVLVAVAIQLIPVSRTNPPALADLNAPAEVKAILKASCYDCHSNETVWPWYSRVAPVSWLVASDATEGRSKFNFSDWNTYTSGRKAGILDHMVREVRRGDMPPWYYTIKHRDAKLTPDKRTTLETWATRP
jgi:mono/diheme cytochrome c family protein